MTSAVARDVTPNATDPARPKPTPRIFIYKHTTFERVSFCDAWKRMFVDHPDRKQPFVVTFLNHRAQAD